MPPSMTGGSPYWFQCQHGYPAGEYCPACGDLPTEDELERCMGLDFDDEEEAA